MRIARTGDAVVHFDLISHPLRHLQRVYACGTCWPRECWSNIAVPRDTQLPEKVTCPECLAALGAAAQPQP